jgi:predicted nicotinamide N-methyase
MDATDSAAGPGSGPPAAPGQDPLRLPPGRAISTTSIDSGAAAAFIAARTSLAAVPLVREIRLYLSRAEPTALWQQTETELGRADLAPPFWAYPWAGGIALARYILDHPGTVAGCTVLDLASGSGLVAIAAALAGAAQVTASDIDPMSVAAIGLNSRANRVSLAVTAADLLASGTLRAEGGAVSAEVVLVGDAWYERRLAHRMLTFLGRAQAAGARALIGDPGRTYLPSTGLRPLASYAVPVWAGLEDTDRKQTTVWEPGNGPAGCRRRRD